MLFHESYFFKIMVRKVIMVVFKFVMIVLLGHNLEVC